MLRSRLEAWLIERAKRKNHRVWNNVPVIEVMLDSQSHALVAPDTVDY
jgi:hypothetical protein